MNRIRRIDDRSCRVYVVLCVVQGVREGGRKQGQHVVRQTRDRNGRTKT